MAGKPITFNVRFPMPYPAYADPERADRLVKQEFMVTMPGALLTIQGGVVTETPFAFGYLRKSIHNEMFERGSNIIGETKTTSPYAWPVETGSKPHWVPIGPLLLWAKRKLGDEKIAYAVQKAIAKRGTKGWHMFARGFAKTKDKVGRLFGEANARILQKLRQK
jgi:hypothetical protein